MAETKLSKLRELLMDGAIAAFYTLNGYFLKIRPCFPIDKVKFSFVKKGSEGQDTLDIYVNTEDFDNFCDDVLSGVMQKKVAADDGDFPNAWTYATGENASKKLSFGSGNSQPYVFQGRYNKINAFVGVGDWLEIKNMAKMWRRVSKSYYEELVGVFMDGMKKIESFHSSDAMEEKSEPIVTNVVAEKPAETPNQVPQTDNRIAVVTGNAQIYTLVPSDQMEQAENYSASKPSFTLKCNCKELGREVEVIFLSAPIGKSSSNFNLLKDRLEKGWRGAFRIEGQMSEYKGKEQLRFTTFVAKGA